MTIIVANLVLCQPILLVIYRHTGPLIKPISSKIDGAYRSYRSSRSSVGSVPAGSEVETIAEKEQCAVTSKTSLTLVDNTEVVIDKEVV